jgi:precorrin-2 dehydrogenase/sirohydrochlorin ferrochelatase
MLIDIDIRGKTVLIFGGGRVGERKAVKFVAAGARVVVASREFTERLEKMDSIQKLRLVRVDLEASPEQVRNLVSNADLVIAATNQSALNRHIAEEAKRDRIRVSVVDNPQLGDFSMPVISDFGEFHIAVSTGGKSPAMSSLLRKRIEGIISIEDIMMVRLQAYARKLAKAQIHNQLSRKRTLHRIAEDRSVRRLLRIGDLQGAKNRAKHIIEG